MALGMKRELDNAAPGLLPALTALPALGPKVHTLRIKIPARIKWAKRHYLDVACHGAQLSSMTHKSEPAHMRLHRDSSRFKGKAKA